MAVKSDVIKGVVKSDGCWRREEGSKKTNFGGRNLWTLPYHILLSIRSNEQLLCTVIARISFFRFFIQAKNRIELEYGVWKPNIFSINRFLCIIMRYILVLKRFSSPLEREVLAARVRSDSERSRTPVFPGMVSGRRTCRGWRSVRFADIKNILDKIDTHAGTKNNVAEVATFKLPSLIPSLNLKSILWRHVTEYIHVFDILSFSLLQTKKRR